MRFMYTYPHLHFHLALFYLSMTAIDTLLNASKVATKAPFVAGPFFVCQRRLKHALFSHGLSIVRRERHLVTEICTRTENKNKIHGARNVGFERGSVG